MNSCINGPELFQNFPTCVIEDKVKIINIGLFFFSFKCEHNMSIFLPFLLVHYIFRISSPENMDGGN